MTFREASVKDIKQLQVVRHLVKENILSDPSLVTDADCARYLTTDGRGWVCESEGTVLGFAIIDTTDNNIWALFVRPEFEKKGIGKKLHDIMVDWHFSHSKDTLWLGTAPRTRAESFYRVRGWQEKGMHGKKEIKFEMSYQDWTRNKNKGIAAH
jgi:GNAT superfamily N-acetyltransferase